MAEEIVQHWEDEAFCRKYAETWEISLSEVHYGWLAPGEESLSLLQDVPLQNAAVLDVGSGMGENLISLAQKGARCFGIDISKHMVRMAEEKAALYMKTSGPDFAIQDMRFFTAFPEVWFDLILSVYSFEYLRSTKELRDVIAILANRLKPGGVFAFCFSHPLQHFGHASLQNETAHSTTASDSTLIYSIRDVVGCLADCDLTIDRLVEQSTANPSTIHYEKGRLFPYHFRPGKNPCVTQYDNLSNLGPHTLIYKTRKPAVAAEIATESLNLTQRSIRLWNKEWAVRDSSFLSAMGKQFPVAELRSESDAYICCVVMHFEIKLQDIIDEAEIYVPLGESLHGGQIAVKRFTLLAIILRRLRKEGLHPVFRRQPFALIDHPSVIQAMFLRRVDPIFGILDRAFPRHHFGVQVFVNRTEPGSGKVGLDSFVPRFGDDIDILYVAPRRRFRFVSDQEELPGLF